jgi:hypothetical protein
MDGSFKEGATAAMDCLMYGKEGATAAIGCLVYGGKGSLFISGHGWLLQGRSQPWVVSCMEVRQTPDVKPDFCLLHIF